MHIFYTVTAAQEGPGIVIAHPGQDVELLCSLNMVLILQYQYQAAWLVNNAGAYRINAIHNGILAGHTATLDSNNLIVENITMNDVRNGSEYRCVIVPAQGMLTSADIIEESDPTILYVAGEYMYERVCILIDHIINDKRGRKLSWFIAFTCNVVKPNKAASYCVMKLGKILMVPLKICKTCESFLPQNFCRL